MIKIAMIRVWDVLPFLILAAFLFGCEKPGISNPVSESLDASPSQSFPIRRKLTNRDGRSIDTEIVGRENDRIHFIRLSDGLQTSSLIDNLSFQDQSFVLQLPVRRPPEGFGRPLARDIGTKENETMRSDLNAIAIQNHERAILQLNQRNADLEARLANVSNQIEERSLMSEIKRNQGEISRISNEISLLQSRSKP